MRGYIGLSLNPCNAAHVRLIAEAAKLCEVTVGVIEDKALINRGIYPIMPTSQRVEIAASIKGVSKVILQSEWDYSSGLRECKPNLFFHGDDWKESDPALYKSTWDYCKEKDIKIIEIPSSSDINGQKITHLSSHYYSTPDLRRGMLRAMVNTIPLTRLIEAHSPLSGLIAEHSRSSLNNRQFHGMWASSLTDSVERGRPDIEALTIAERIDNIKDIFDVTTKPLVMDCDTGGIPEHLVLNITRLERLGVSAAIIEDKTGLKRNSLFGNDVEQTQAPPQEFAEKIRKAKDACITREFMIIARIESLILEKGMEDALHRSKVYQDAGADAIMIHSRLKDGLEIKQFCSLFRETSSLPLVVVPTSFNAVTEDVLQSWGVNVVIYANQLLRASYPAMHSTAKSILDHGRSLEVDQNLTSISEILSLIPGT